jgi:hypothetical protein
MRTQNTGLATDLLFYRMARPINTVSHTKMIIPISIIGCFILLVIVGFRYDQIVPPVVSFLQNFYDWIAPFWFKKLGKKNKFITICLVISVIYIFYATLWLIFIFPKGEDLKQVHSKDIHNFFNTSGSVIFWTDDGTFLKYWSTSPKYDYVVNSLQNKNNFTFWIDSHRDPPTIFQISANDELIVPYKDLYRHVILSMVVNLIINLLFVIFSSPQLLKTIRKNSQKIVVENNG